MIIVSDTTPIISLLKAERLDLLSELFGEILIPEAVLRELTTNKDYQDEAQIVKTSRYIRVVTVDDKEYVAMIQEIAGLDEGESEAIAYANRNNVDYILIDEVKARETARNLKIPVMGSVGVLIRANKKGILSRRDVEDALNKIKQSGQYISDELIRTALEAINVK